VVAFPRKSEHTLVQQHTTCDQHPFSPLKLLNSLQFSEKTQGAYMLAWVELRSALADNNVSRDDVLFYGPLS
jgi:hypothetical protein